MQLSSNRPVHFGANLVLRCNFSSSNPATVSFRWKKNGILEWQEQELHFDAITPEDSGTYHCEVNNSIGHTQSPAQVVSVLCEWLPWGGWTLAEGWGVLCILSCFSFQMHPAGCM